MNTLDLYSLLEVRKYHDADIYNDHQLLIATFHFFLATINNSHEEIERHRQSVNMKPVALL